MSRAGSHRHPNFLFFQLSQDLCKFYVFPNYLQFLISNIWFILRYSIRLIIPELCPLVDAPLPELCSVNWPFIQDGHNAFWLVEIWNLWNHLVLMIPKKYCSLAFVLYKFLLVELETMVAICDVGHGYWIIIFEKIKM
jgi:hypothetical protein